MLLQNKFATSTLQLTEAVTQTERLIETMHFSLEYICRNEIEVDRTVYIRELLHHSQSALEQITRTKLPRVTCEFETISWNLLRVAQLETRTNHSVISSLHQSFVKVYTATQVCEPLSS